MPFANLIKNLFQNKKIKLIISQNKKDVLISFVTDILCIFINIIFYFPEYKVNIERYKLFFFCVLAELDSALLSEKEKIIDKAINYGYSNSEKIINNLIDIMNIINKESKEDKSKFILNLIKEEKILFHNYDYFFNQFNTKLMKELFIFNQNWSKKDLFFNINIKDNEIAIKYKQLNYYTKSFQQPFIYPILEIDKYYPKFNNFNEEKLYKNPNQKILNYDFSLSENNIILKEIKKYITQNKNENNEFEKCCLVKAIYHVKGKLGVFKSEGNNESFIIVFISNDKEEEYTCNKEDYNVNDNIQIKLREKTKNTCYGSILRCPKKEYNKKIVIKSEDILFLLFREYLHRVSGIEIFTTNNKSYYFNFNKKFDLKKENKRRFSLFNKYNKNNFNKDYNNKLQDEDNDEEVLSKNSPINDENDNSSMINNNEIEKELIKDLDNIDNIIISNITKEFKIIYKNKILLGFYNKKYQKIFYPFIEIKSFNLKNKYLSNYDILIYINLLANRSFKDLFQYPVFPMFYDAINKKRDMNKHIGFQSLDEQSKSRIELIIDSYKCAYEDYHDKNDSNNLVCLFNTHYSNPIYTSNYLIRVFPYSLSCIELQGDGFDNPNRLFYSIDYTMNNTLNQKSDLRELIPEIFYFYELFINRNNLQFNKIANKQEIDTVKINSEKENEKNDEIYKFITYMRNKLEKEEKLNEWIDLIFGINSEKDENRRNYYAKSTFVTFDNNEELLKDRLVMESTDFGLIPFKLFNSKFPIIKRDNIDNLKIFNNQMVEQDHFINYSNSLKCCMCIGRLYIDNDYLDCYKSKNKQLIENLKIISKLKEIENIFYYFIGDIFGNVTIYRFNKQNSLTKNVKKIINTIHNIPKHRYSYCLQYKNENKIKYSYKNQKSNDILKNENKVEPNDWIEVSDTLSNEMEYNAQINGSNEEEFVKVTIFKKINAHHKQIKYIDFNGRLNAFVTYALDGFINIYLFPSCKLVNSFKVENFVGAQCIFDKVLLVSTPFPMIICKNAIILYIFDINGNFIHVESTAECRRIQIHVDKNCGIVQDYITKDGKDYSFPFIEQIKNKSNI